MKCYNKSCTEECDTLKLATCLFRQTKEMYEARKKIGNRCSKCNERQVYAKIKNGRSIKLCTHCGEVEEFDRKRVG